MKNCHEFDTAITDYLMEECGGDTKVSVEEHLLACTECRGRFDERKATAEALRALSASTASLSEERRAVILETAATPPTKPRRRIAPWWNSLAATVVVAAIIAIVLVIQEGNDSVVRNAEVAKVAGEPVVNVRMHEEPAPYDPAKKRDMSRYPSVLLDKQGADSQIVPVVVLEPGPDIPKGLYAGAADLSTTEDTVLTIQPGLSADSVTFQAEDDSMSYHWRKEAETPARRISLGDESNAPVTKAKPDEIDAYTLALGTRGRAGEKSPKPAKPRPDVSQPKAGPSGGGGHRLADEPDTNLNAFSDPPATTTAGGYAQESADSRVRRYFEVLKRRPGEEPHMMFFRYWGDNPFVDTTKDAQSTFGMDVDTASYTLTRNYLSRGLIPPKESIRTEEFVNYIPSNYPAPDKGDFGIHVEMAPSRFARQNDVFLMKVGIKAREVAESARKPLALTFVIDVSGSMSQDSRLELVKDSIRILASELNENDTVGIVVFESSARNILDHVSARDLDTIANALTPLRPGSSTNVQHGLELGYSMALRALKKDSMNRVVLFSDGVANTGQTQAEAILERVAQCKEQGIFLNTFGVGMGNHNDHLLEQLANKGDGICAYIDNRREAVRLFRKNLVGSFHTIAKDAKVQVDFDPELISSHRQIGYENRAIAHQDFRNDAIDAGEINAGHEVVALYEIQIRRQHIDSVIFGQKSPAKVKVRYKQVETGEVVELDHDALGKGITDFANASPRFRASAMAAAFADLLRNSYWSRKVQMAEVQELAQSLVVLDNTEDSRISELVALLKQADSLIKDRLAQVTAEEKALEQVKYNYYLRNRLTEARAKDARELQAKLEKENEKLEDELRKLMRE